MPLFNVTVREHAYTGQVYGGVVQAESCEQALRVAAGQATTSPVPPSPKPRRGFGVAVTEHAYPGRSYTDVVRAQSCQEALQVAAGQAATPQPAPGPKPQPSAARGRRCADVWVYSLLHLRAGGATRSPAHGARARLPANSVPAQPPQRRPACTAGRPHLGAHPFEWYRPPVRIQSARP
jgi:hypothetical protein